MGGFSVAFSKISVAVCGFIYSLEDFHWVLLMWTDTWVITAVDGSQAYATTTFLGRCIAFAEKLDSRIWNGWNGAAFITEYAANIICLCSSRNLGLTVWILEAEVWTSTRN